MSDLHDRNCSSCAWGVAAIKQEKAVEMLSQLDSWKLVEGHHLRREFKFANFVEALSFVNQVGEIAEHEMHHPDLLLSWGRVRVDIWTHTIDGLSENDFILAAKIDQIA